MEFGRLVYDAHVCTIKDAVESLVEILSMPTSNHSGHRYHERLRRILAAATEAHGEAKRGGTRKGNSRLSEALLVQGRNHKVR